MLNLKYFRKKVLKDSSYKPSQMNCIQINQNLTWNQHKIDVTRFEDLMLSHFVFTEFISIVKE